MRRYSYPACFYKDETGYAVFFPDLDQLATCGDTLDDAFLMAMDCLAAHLHWEKKENRPFPEPSSPEEVNLDDIPSDLDFQYDDGFVSMITIDLEEYVQTHFEETARPTVKISASLYYTAADLDIDISSVLQDALEEKLLQISKDNSNL